MEDMSKKLEVYLDVMQLFSGDMGYQNAGNALFLREVVQIMSGYSLTNEEKIERVYIEILARAQAELTIKREKIAKEDSG